MPTKSKVIIGIVLLAVGSGLVPTGLLINDYLVDRVYNGVPEAMIEIKNEALPSLMEQIPPLATPDVLKGFKEEAIVGVESVINMLTTPQVLREVNESVKSDLVPLINGSVTAQIIEETITMAKVGFNGSVAATLEYFFNDQNWNATINGTSTILGISEWAGGGNLTYSPYAQNTLMYTGVSLPSIADIPGMLTDLEMGSGILTFLEVFTYTVDPGINASMQGYYNVTWKQLSDIAEYFTSYMFSSIVPSFIGMTPQQYAPILFLEQWANGTYVSGGIDLHLLDDDIVNGTYGLEAGIPTPTNIPIIKCIDLWNDSIAITFVNDDGIRTWVEAAEGNTTLQSLLSTTFNITTTQLTILYGWLNNFINNLTPVLVEAEPGPTINELATLAFYEQWANGTISGEVFLPDGFLGEFNSSYAGAPYFEVGLPIASNLTLTECIALWNETNTDTFINRISFANHWLPAIEEDPSNKSYLEGAFSLSINELDAILGCLEALINMENPLTGRIVNLLEYELNMSLTEIATFAVYEQWSNGTIYGNVILPDGLLSEWESPIYGPPYFEVSLTVYSLEINNTQVQALWDQESKYSLVTKSGIQNWYKAKEGNTIYETLRIQNHGLQSWQMYAILKWLPQFRDNIVNKLGKDDMNLPMEPYALGGKLSFSLGLTGGVLAALGVVFLMISRRS